MRIDMIMLNETNCKWSTITIDKTWNVFMSASKDVSTNTSDSKEHALNQNEYLPGGKVTTVFGKLSSHIVETSKH